MKATSQRCRGHVPRAAASARWEPRRSHRPLATGLLIAALGASCSQGHAASGEPHAQGAAADTAPDEARVAASEPAGQPVAEQFEVPPPPFSEGVFPCSDCHDPQVPVRRSRRELKFAHQDIVLRHDEEHRWCLDCHDAEDRDSLHLASGERVPFEESYRLCGQCHGDKYASWRRGIHGRRTGHWDGAKQYLLCVHCHNAHDPAFKPLKPLPPPPRPHRTP